QASLYYHAPGGKEELFVMVLERSLQRHREGLERAIAVADGGIETRLRAIAHWLIEQPPVNLFRIVKSDMGSIDCEQAERLSNMAFQAVFEPVVAVFRGAQQLNEIRDHPVDVLAGSFLAVMDGIWFAHHHFGSAYPMEQMADMMIDTLLNGLRPRD